MKKFVSIALAAVMILSMLLCGISANAATSTAIDVNQKGSVTLYKYKTGTKGDNNTGEPVQGAGFSFYKILSYDGSGYKLTELAKNAVNAYNSTAEDNEKYDLNTLIDSIVITNGEDDVDGDDGYASYGSTETLENLIAVFQAYINANPTAADGDLETGENGSGTANNLALGIYLVSETQVPDGFIASTASFLVSVPSWDNDTKAWDYSIDAYPKDQPFDIGKEIVADDGANTTDTDSREVGDTVTFKVNGSVPNYGKSNINTDVNVTQDRVVVSQTTYNKLPFVFTDTLSEGLTYADNLKISVAGTPESVILKQDTDAEYINDGKEVQWGTSGDYFFTFDEATNTVTVIIKWDSLDSYQGNDITFTYDAVVNEKAVVTDGNSNSAKITVANNPSTYNGDYSNVTTDEFTSSTDTSTVYTYSMTLNKTFNSKTYEDAGVDPTAVKFEIAAGSGRDSDVYSFLTAGDGEYTLWEGMTVTEGENTYAVIYDLDADGNKQTAGADDLAVNGFKVKYVTGDKTSSELTTELALGTKASLIIKGLENKTYYVTETSTVDGYSVLAQSVPVQVKDVATAEVKTTNYYPFVAYSADDFEEGTVYYQKTDDGYTQITDLNGFVSTADNIKVVYYAVEEVTVSAGNASSDVEASVVGGETLKGANAQSPSGNFDITVNNSKNQFNLPLTGGLGLMLFTIAGGVVMAFAIIIFSVIRKKHKAKKASA